MTEEAMGRHDSLQQDTMSLRLKKYTGVYIGFNMKNIGRQTANRIQKIIA